MKRMAKKMVRVFPLTNGQSLVLQAGIHGTPRGDSPEPELKAAIIATILRGYLPRRTDKIFL